MEFYDLNKLYDAFILSKKGSSWKMSVQKYESDLLRNLIYIQKQLMSKTYKQKPFYEFDLNERGKCRHIKSLHISDRVVQRSFCDNVLIPATENKLIYDNGASRQGKGITFARKRLIVHLRKFYNENKSNEGYILQLDFKKFFDSIPHDILKENFKNLLTPDEYNFFASLIDTFEGENGVGIGSQISQVSGIYYPTRLDSYFKIVKGVKYYGRYMDDTYIIHSDKDYLKQLLQDYLSIAEKLGLIVNLKKTHIIKLSHGFTFLQIKYNLLEDGTILKRLGRKGITRERRKLKKYRRLVDKGQLQLATVIQAYKSWRGTYKRFNSYNTIRNMDSLYNRLFGGIYYECETRQDYGKTCTAKIRFGRQSGSE